MEGCCGSVCSMLNGKRFFNYDILECDYLNWKKPALTGGILASINLFFLAILISDMSLFTILAYFFLFYVIAGIIITQFSEKSENEYIII